MTTEDAIRECCLEDCHMRNLRPLMAHLAVVAPRSWDASDLAALVALVADGVSAHAIAKPIIDSHSLHLRENWDGPGGSPLAAIVAQITDAAGDLICDLSLSAAIDAVLAAAEIDGEHAGVGSVAHHYVAVMVCDLISLDSPPIRPVTFT